MVNTEGKKRIVVASVLKPVNDTRMTGKIAQSLADAGRFDVHIMGYASETISTSASSLTFHPLPPFTRISFARILIPWRICSKIIALKPDLLIITTHELIVAAVLAKVATGCKVIYDVQENYYRNIRHTNAFPPVLRNVIAAYVRLKEWILAPAINHFFLAEQNYTNEMSFFGNRYTIVENKVRKRSSTLRKVRDVTKLLFSGTLGESTGVFTAIDLADQLHAIDPAVTLTIIGYCARKNELDRVKSIIRERRYITLIGGDRLVPHTEILKEIDKAGAGIIAYPPNPSTQHSTPTKLFEYLGNGLPILLVDNPAWVEHCSQYQAAVVFKTAAIDAKNLHYLLKNTRFYPVLPAEVYWESEEPKVIETIKRLF